jgi:hypothetical protein
MDRGLFPSTVHSGLSLPRWSSYPAVVTTLSVTPLSGAPSRSRDYCSGERNCFWKIWMKSCIVEIPSCSAVLWDSVHNYWCNPAFLCFVRDVRQYRLRKGMADKRAAPSRGLQTCQIPPGPYGVGCVGPRYKELPGREASRCHGPTYGFSSRSIGSECGQCWVPGRHSLICQGLSQTLQNSGPFK